MVITLIGYRGSGKSSVAAPLAERLGWQAVDADVEIERQAGKCIADIFVDEGETRFRELERQMMKQLLDGDRMVVAAGGGAILNYETRRQMKESGPVVWLTAPVEVLTQRIGHDETTASRRPNLTATGGTAEIERVLADREPLYRECATVVVDSSQQSPGELVDEIIAAIGPLADKDG